MTAKKTGKPASPKKKAPTPVQANEQTLATARKALQSGRPADAEKAARKILGKSPRNIAATELLAMTQLQQGRSEEALAQMRRLVSLAPGTLHAQINLGNVLLSTKRHAEALAAFDVVLSLQPDHAQAHVSRGVLLGILGRKEEALQSYEKALQSDPTHADALNNAGTLLGNLGRHEEAIDYYRRALNARPQYPEALNNLAVSLVAVDRRDEALDKYAAAVALKPDYADAIKNRAELLALMGKNAEALDAYDKVVALMPTTAEIHNNRSTVLNALNRYREALAGYDVALALKPDYPDALNNRGITLAALNRFEEALQCFRQAIALQPDYVNAHWNESLSLLRLGRFEEGWKKHEWRWRKPEFEQHKHDFTQPLWLGQEDLAGKTILLVAEQGFGDILHFCRYVPLLEAKGAKVLLFVPEALVALLRQSFPATQAFSKANTFPPFDYYCPFLSLPLAFGTTLETIPAATPYLRVEDKLRRDWRRRIGHGDKLRVGIVWAGSATHKNDINRSMAFDIFSPILKASNAHFYSLQKEMPASDRDTLTSMPQVTLLGDELGSFVDTAAAIEALDIVISVDTAVAHLAAALGKPTWILLPFVSDWRWLPGREDSPWYPTARLYWQADIDLWPQVIGRVATKLHDMPAPNREETENPPPLSMTEALQTATRLLGAGSIDDAETICRTLLDMQPAWFDALMLMGTLQLKRQQVNEAIASFDKAVDLRPDNVQALLNLSSAMRLANRHQDALPLYDQAAAIAPDNASVAVNRAVSLIALKQYPEALQAIDQALKLDPNSLAALNNRGVVFNEQQDHGRALDSFDQALAIKPDYADASNNRGLALIGLDRPAEADRNYLAAIAIHPDNAGMYNNRGLALAAMNRVDEALACFQKAKSLIPDYVDACWNESLMNLVAGNFTQGWQQYEWRWRKPEFAPHKREFHLPQWTGKEDVRGRTLFLHFEQGFGDTLQFVRYIDLLDALGAKVVMSCPESLRGLLAASYPQVGFFCGGETLPPFDFHIPLLSLPLAFATTLGTIPSRSPYLKAPPDALLAWQERMPPSPKLRVGLVWSGNPKHKNDHNRSFPLAAMSDILDMPGYEFFALQKEINDSDRELLRTHAAVLLDGQLNDFSDTAAAIMQLDLVISVDTSVAHLAGALGKPLWLLLPFAPDWRWLLDRADSPWYPTARLFRQTATGAASTLLRAVADALTDWGKTR